MTLEAWKLELTDPDLSEVLDACHMLSSNAYRPDWACTNPPHPARLQFDEIMQHPEWGIVVVKRDDVISGWLAYNEHAEIINGNIVHGLLNGEGALIDGPSQELLSEMIYVIKFYNGGNCYHVAWQNPRMWYGLQETMGLEPSPRFPDRAGLVPTEPE